MKKEIKEKDMKVGELAVLMRDAFQSSQDYMDKKFNSIDEKFDSIDKKFDSIDKKFDSLAGQMNKNFSEVKKQIDNINRNNVDVVHQEDFDKLEQRVVDVEEVLHLKIKKA